MSTTEAMIIGGSVGTSGRHGSIRDVTSCCSRPAAKSGEALLSWHTVSRDLSHEVILTRVVDAKSCRVVSGQALAGNLSQLI
jgi:hypothetical protein